eukprot:CFRG4507T1
MNENHVACLQAYSALNNNVQELGGTISELNHTVTVLNDRMRGLERRLLKIYTPFRSSIYAYNNVAQDDHQSKLPELNRNQFNPFDTSIRSVSGTTNPTTYQQQPAQNELFSSNCPQF